MTHEERPSDVEDSAVEGAAPDGEVRPLPPIPDGGLGGAMPDWLTRPTPATMRRMARRSGLAEPFGFGPTSDDFARVEDVPGWMQAVRRRTVAPPAPPTDAPPVEAPPPVSRVEPIFVEARPHPAPPALLPPDAPEPSTPPPTATVPQTSDRTPTWWLVLGFLIALVTAFIIGMVTGSGFRP